MSKVGTTYLIKVQVDGWGGQCTRDLDFDLSFFVYRNRRIELAKGQLVHVERGGQDLYYAAVDSRLMGEGAMKVAVTIHQQVNSEQVAVRDVVLEAQTAIRIGRDSNNYTCCEEVCVMREQGYTVILSAVSDIPASDVVYAYYAVVKAEIASLAELTEAMLDEAGMHALSIDGLTKNRISFGALTAGDKALVLIPSDSGIRALKDDGLGGRAPFDTAILGSNGEQEMAYKGGIYALYGEMVTADGELYFYLEN